MAVLLVREKPECRRARWRARSASGRITGVRTLSGSERASSGVAGLDDILGGGFVPGRLHLLEGKAGAGKTTLGMQFFLAVRDGGGKVLFVRISQRLNELPT